MSKSVSTTTVRDESMVEIDLNDPRLAAFLAWLVPGLGHIYQRRTGKGVLFFVCIVGTFIYGMYIGGGRVVYASTADVFSKQFLERWQYICQVGVGLPALPAIVQRQRELSGKGPLSEFERPPRKNPPDGGPRDLFESIDSAGNVVKHPDELAKWNYDYGERFEIGTMFTVIAGLLNILAIFDAYGGPLIVQPEEEKKADNKAAAPTEAKR